MWNNNNAAFSSSDSSCINTDYSLSSFMEGGGSGESSSLRSPNEYDKLFLSDWFTSSYSKDGAVVINPEMEFSSSSLPFSPLPFTSSTSVGLNSEEKQIITSQPVSSGIEKKNEKGEVISMEDSSRGTKRLKSTCTQKEAHKPPLMEASVKQPAKAQAKRTQKIGHKIAALQQLVCPFGKTHTASVLDETASCIKFLHDQLKILTTPYMGIQSRNEVFNDKRNELRKRGLCLVPISPEVVNLISQVTFDPSLPGNQVPRSRFQL